MNEQHQSDVILTKLRNDYFKEHNVFCPYCSYQIRKDALGEKDLISYHGDATVQDCPKCEKEFSVVEHVDRTYVSKKMEDVQ